MAQYDNTTATYRYFVVNLVTNQQIAEIPFKGVSYQRALKGAGSFSGNIAVNPETEHLQVYESTMPGRTALYVVRDGVCVWGGIIWSRSYNVNDRVLNVSASEFTSYFYHRRIWKTWGQTFQATLTAKDGLIDAQLSYGSTYALVPGSTVRYVFFNTSNWIYNGYYTILDTPTPTEDSFRTTNLAKDGVNAVPNGVYENVTVYAKTNTYDYVRTLIEAVAQDFAGIDFPNTEIEPAKKTTINVTSRSIANNVATINVDSPASIVEGQEIEIRNVSPLIDGLHTVSSINETGNVITISDYPGTLATANVSKSLFRITEWEAAAGKATLTTNAAHGLFIGQTVTISGLDAVDTAGDVFDTTAVIASIPTSTKFTYNVAAAADVTVLPVTLSAPTATVSTNTFFLTRQEIEKVGANTVATLTTGEPHNFAVGNSVTIAGFKDYTTITRTAANAAGITYTTSRTHYYQVGKPVTVTGLADTSNVTFATANITGNTTTFAITTATAHNLVTGNAVTISGMTDSYSISSYQYFSTNSTLRLTTTTPTNINIASGQSLTVSGMVSRTVGASSISRSGSTVTINTNAAHGISGGQSVTVSGFNLSYTATINSLSRVSNVTTATTTSPHGFVSGQSISISAYNAPSNFSEYNATITVLSDYSFSYYNPVAPTVTQDTTSTTSGSGTTTLVYADHRSWKASGSSWTVISGNDTANYDQAAYIYPASSGTTSLARRAAIRFESLANSLPAGITLANVTAVTSAVLTLSRTGQHDPGASASFALSTAGDLTTFSTTQPSPISSLTERLATSNWSLNQTRNLTIPASWYPHIANGTGKTILTSYLSSAWEDVAESTSELINFHGSTTGKEPYITVNYTYTLTTGTPGQTIPSDDTYSGANAAFASLSISGVNGTFTATVNSETSISYTSSQSSPDFSTSSGLSGVSINSGTNPFNGTYVASDLLARTSNTIDIRKVISISNVAATPTSGTIATSSNFNGTYNVTYVSPTTVSWTLSDTGAYMYANVSRSVPAGQGQAIVLSTDFNVTNSNITGVTSTTFTVANPTGRVKTDADVTPRGVAVSDSPLAGTYTITAITSDSFKYNVSNSLPAQTGTPIYGYANVTSTPTLTYGTYGPYALSSDVGIDFSTYDSTGSDVLPIEYRGFEVRNVGEELDKYTDIIDGFDYRIDCYVDPDTGTFSREFVFLPIVPPAVKEYKETELTQGEPIPIRLYGADKLVFEFPGNISDLQLEESAENSATRFFMVGNIGDLGDDISQPYAVATATDLLNPAVGEYPWPILDDDESSEDISDEETLYSYAERYLLENRPPEGKFTVTVNGSLQPIIGTYGPGDWCALIINDDFIKQRLSSDLEPRNTVLLRKINAMSVEVPDSVTFPERIELELIPEWQVDQRGQQKISL